MVLLIILFNVFVPNFSVTGRNLEVSQVINVRYWIFFHCCPVYCAVSEDGSNIKACEALPQFSLSVVDCLIFSEVAMGIQLFFRDYCGIGILEIDSGNFSFLRPILFSEWMELVQKNLRKKKKS